MALGMRKIFGGASALALAAGMAIPGYAGTATNTNAQDAQTTQTSAAVTRPINNQAPNAETIPAGAFRMELLQDDDNNPRTEHPYISATVERGEGYVVFNMDDPQSTQAGAIGLLELRIALRTMAEEGKEPIIMTNYNYETAQGELSLNSRRQSGILDRVLPIMAEQTERPIVLINAVSMRRAPNGEINGLYLGGLLQDLAEDNGLGGRGAHRDIGDKVILPYTLFEDPEGQTEHGFAWGMITTIQEDPENGVTHREIANGLFSDAQSVVRSVNERFASADHPRTQTASADRSGPSPD